MKCPIVSVGVSMGLACLWSACLLMLMAVFQLCWRISMACLAQELFGSSVQIVFIVGMEAFG